MSVTVDYQLDPILLNPRPEHGEVRPALVLDLDGTIRQSKSGATFPNDASDIQLIRNADDATPEALLWEYREQGFLILGVTNQGGVAYGFRTPDEEIGELRATIALFERSPFHLITSCWHHEKARHALYGTKSLRRKPHYGALAILEWELLKYGVMIDWSNSLMVGDRPEDEECAAGAGIAYHDATEFFGRSVL